MEVITRASIEIQIVMAIGAVFAVMVIIAVVNLWYGTQGNDRNK